MWAGELRDACQPDPGCGFCLPHSRLIWARNGRAVAQHQRAAKLWGVPLACFRGTWTIWRGCRTCLHHRRDHGGMTGRRYLSQRLRPHLLRAADAIESERSLLKASAVLGITQPALTKSLQELEE